MASFHLPPVLIRDAPLPRLPKLPRGSLAVKPLPHSPKYCTRSHIPLYCVPLHAPQCNDLYPSSHHPFPRAQRRRLFIRSADVQRLKSLLPGLLDLPVMQLSSSSAAGLCVSAILRPFPSFSISVAIWPLRTAGSRVCAPRSVRAELTTTLDRWRRASASRRGLIAEVTHRRVSYDLQEGTTSHVIHRHSHRGRSIM
jgi:hypothetical protein